MSVELTQKANITGKVISPLLIDKTLTKEYMCAEAKATGDAIREIEEDNEIQEINLIASPKITSTKGVCYKSGRICQLVFEFTVNETNLIGAGETIYSGLPTPKDDADFVTYYAGGIELLLNIHPIDTVHNGGVLRNDYENNITSGRKVSGTVTYITTD